MTQVASKAILDSHRKERTTDLGQTVFDEASFRNRFAPVLFPSSSRPASDLDLRILLQYMSRDRKELIYRDEVS